MAFVEGGKPAYAFRYVAAKEGHIRYGAVGYCPRVNTNGGSSAPAFDQLASVCRIGLEGIDGPPVSGKAGEGAARAGADVEHDSRRGIPPHHLIYQVGFVWDESIAHRAFETFRQSTESPLRDASRSRPSLPGERVAHNVFGRMGAVIVAIGIGLRSRR